MADNEKKVAETAQASVAEKKTDAPAPKAEKKPKKDKVKFTDRVKKFWRDYKRSTVVVVSTIVVFAVCIAILDFLFSKGLTLLSHIG